QENRRLDFQRRKALLGRGIGQPSGVAAPGLPVLARVPDDDRSAPPDLVQVGPRTLREASVAKDQGMVVREEADMARHPLAPDHEGQWRSDLGVPAPRDLLGQLSAREGTLALIAAEHVPADAILRVGREEVDADVDEAGEEEGPRPGAGKA